MTSTVRPATVDDAEAIAALHIASWRAVYREELPAAFLDGLDPAARAAEWRRRLADPALTVLVDAADGSIRGVCAVGPTDDPARAPAGTWQLHQLHIAPALRGGGIGSGLFDAALGVARAAGAFLVTLWVVETNAQARRFYERRGMRSDGARQHRDLAPGAVLHELRYRLPLPRVRPAVREDLPAIEALIAASARALSAGFYTPAQVDALLAHVFGADTQLLEDGTYYVVEWSGALLAAGGWSRRRTLYGGDRMKAGADPPLDPRTEPARIRAFFVHPDSARQGLGRLLFAHCRRAAVDDGFRGFTLVATAPGEPLYQALGFVVSDRFALELPGGVAVPVARMARGLP